MKLNEAKKLAIIFLNLDIKPSEVGDLIVYHPFIKTPFLMDEKGIFNALDTPERWKEYKNKFKADVIEKCDSIEQLLFFVGENYRLTFLKYLLHDDIVTIQECGNLLAKQWLILENINHDANVKKTEVLEWIKCADKNILMGDRDLEIYSNLGEEIVIYRGCSRHGNKNGSSWTIDKKVADWFARRFLKDGEYGRVYTAKVRKKNIIAYLDTKEKEVIVDWRGVFDVKMERVRR